ncbi:hypothetical protein [Acidaminococcus timonensis]|uniref:hypothetical protein n=1 Tax=Acidaminococcus timonensis TaxID=1871002 RepID=UPI00307D7F19
MDLNIKITLTCDDYMTRLVDAVVRSLDAIDGAVAPMASAPTQEAVPQPQPEKQEIPEVRHAPVVQQAPAPAPAPQPAPVVPTAPARTYSLNDLLTAAAPLMDQGKFQELSALTAKYGVKSFTDIPEDQYGNVAVDLRALGAAL